ncbi:uncharacterized protein LOC144713800 [Wolffia australiana]
MEVVGEEAMDPHHDIHALFCYYNSVYFGDSLGACCVSWSSSRMTRCAGVCHCAPGGGCEIRLSEPLLKFRLTSDLKNTLLHEMIHAFLWIHYKNRDHSDHGPSFRRLMDAINSSSVDDHQRPAGGYNITVCHDFHAEVDHYQTHRWMCEACGDVIKRAMNRAPSPSDCIQKTKPRKEPCQIPHCHWHRHLMLCPGSYVKIAEPINRKKNPGESSERKCRKITSFFPSVQEKGEEPVGPPVNKKTKRDVVEILD